MKLLVFSLLLVGALAAPRSKPMFPRGLNKIVGGTDAMPGEFPYQISFQSTTFGAFHFCGGSVYTNVWMITAAHCVQGEDFNNPQNLQIVAGDHVLYTPEGNEQTEAVTRIVQHENYNQFTISNDISLLLIGNALTFNGFVGPVTLPAQLQDSNGDIGRVTGWGALSEGGSAASMLQKVDVPIVTDAECRLAYGVSDVDDSMICAGLPEGGKDSCQGDSGGPMWCVNGGYLCGIVSWGFGCARPGFPGVYCEVSYFVDWILANAN